MPVVSVPVRVATPDVDPLELGRKFKAHVAQYGCKKAFALHSYNYLTKPRAVCARSLHNMFPLVADPTNT
eukprot:5280105-Pyramimonas_sp.AAC.1